MSFETAFYFVSFFLFTIKFKIFTSTREHFNLHLVFRFLFFSANSLQLGIFVHFHFWIIHNYLNAGVKVSVSHFKCFVTIRNLLYKIDICMQHLLLMLYFFFFIFIFILVPSASKILRFINCYRCVCSLEKSSIWVQLASVCYS